MIIADTTSSGAKYVPDYLTFIPTAERCKNCECLASGVDRMICVFSHCVKNEEEK
jgi:hypothetical protein